MTIIAEVADALETAHQGGVVHRDVKPANILISPDGRVLVADFGIAKAGGDLTTTNTTLGTAKYLAPEQVEGLPVDARSDVYALGVVLYETLCGRPPFVADTEAATALARLHQEPMRPRNVRAGVPKAIEDVVLHAMARDPNDRYPSAAAFRAALLAAGRGTATSPPLTIGPSASSPVDATVATNVPQPDRTPPEAPPTFVRTERGWLVPTAVIVLIAAALIIGGAFLAGGGSVPTLPGIGGDDDGPTASNPVTLAEAAAFDPPPGDGAENDGDAPLAIDTDPNTFWQTQGYNDPAIQIKPGVGLIVTLAQSATLETLKVTSPTSGWAAQVFVADTPQPDVASWGDPVDQKDGIAAGTVDFDLGGREGGAVLIWITNVGTSPDDAGRFHTQIAEINVGH